jgi:hypothetical protein
MRNLVFDLKSKISNLNVLKRQTPTRLTLLRMVYKISNLNKYSERMESL